jgi:hypothetical protein
MESEMKSAYETMRDDQLERKLKLYLGSQQDWMEIYGEWRGARDVSDTEAHEHHNVQIFVREMKERPDTAKRPAATLLRRRG